MFDLAAAKARLNIVGTGQDVLLQASLDAALSLAEKYCDRFFMFASERAKFYHVRGNSLFLRRYPVTDLIAMTPSGLKYKLHMVTGIVEFHSATSEEEIVIDYSGGYSVLPPDLELALWQIFDSVWNLGQAAGGGGLAAGAIQSVTLADVGTVRYATGAAAADAAAGASIIPAIAVNILDLYRSTEV